MSRTASFLARRARGGVTVVLAAACGGDAPRCDAVVDGVDVVVSTGAGTWEGAGMQPHLVELWRVGGTNEGQELAFPIHAAASADHLLAIPDFMLDELIVVDADGAWRQRVLRRGRGPGELASAVAAGWDERGRLAVFDVINAKAVVLDSRLDVVDELALPPAFTAPIVMSGGLVQAGIHSDGSGFIQPLWSRRADGAEPRGEAVVLYRQAGGEAADTLLRVGFDAAADPAGMVWPPPGRSTPWAAMGPDGGVTVVGLTGEYAVVQYDGAGQPVRQLCRPDAPVLGWTDEERGLGPAPDGWDALQPGVRAARLPPVPPAAGRVFVGADGRIWVQRERTPAYPGSDSHYGAPGGQWDVFAADGEFLGTLVAPPGARLQTANAERAWAFEIGDLDETWVVAYRIELRAAGGD